MSWTKVEPKEVTDVLDLQEVADLSVAEIIQASEKTNVETMANVAHKLTQGKSKVRKEKVKADMVNNPPHYTSHPSGIECIQITEHMGFNLGNALKYIWRADLKGSAVEDLEKAIFYINRELDKRDAK
jgi:hypothetical protein